MKSEKTKPKKLEEYLEHVFEDLTCAMFKPGTPAAEISKSLELILSKTAPYFELHPNKQHPSSFFLLTSGTHGMEQRTCLFFFDDYAIKVAIPDPTDTYGRQAPLAKEKFPLSEMFLNVDRLENWLREELAKMLHAAYKE